MAKLPITHRKANAPVRDKRAEAPHSVHPPRGKSQIAGSQEPHAACGAIVSRRAADRLRAGHLWVYASDVESVTVPDPEGDPPPLLLVADGRGLSLGTALYSPTSQIALRMVSRQALDQAGWLKLLESRLRSAIARRKPMLDAANDACRLCFSEADEVPA